MSQSLRNCIHKPSWVKTFLAATKDGYTFQNSANMAGVGTITVKQRLEKHADFKVDYETAVETKRERPGHGAW